MRIVTQGEVSHIVHIFIYKGKLCGVALTMLLHCSHLLYDLNAEKNPSPVVTKPQATCSLSMCHGSHTLTGMEFSSAFYHT